MPETLRPPIDAQLEDLRQDITRLMLRLGVAHADLRRDLTTSIEAIASQRNSEIKDLRQDMVALVGRTTFALTDQIVELSNRVCALEPNQ